MSFPLFINYSYISELPSGIIFLVLKSHPFIFFKADLLVRNVVRLCLSFKKVFAFYLRECFHRIQNSTLAISYLWYVQDNITLFCWLSFALLLLKGQTFLSGSFFFLFSGCVEAFSLTLAFNTFTIICLGASFFIFILLGFYGPCIYKIMSFVTSRKCSAITVSCIAMVPFFLFSI